MTNRPAQDDGWVYYRWYDGGLGSLYRQGLTGLTEHWTGSEWVRARDSVAYELRRVRVIGNDMYMDVSAGHAGRVVDGRADLPPDFRWQGRLFQEHGELREWTGTTWKFAHRTVQDEVYRLDAGAVEPVSVEQMLAETVSPETLARWDRLLGKGTEEDPG